ncbi:MAG: hypothetical protein O6763_05000 [Gammaproteobacteria bacterium]|nr:hypothetical protein [Gammaproteobacteria bacterium]
MSEKNPIRIFVSHAFAEDEDYARVFEYFESRDRFFYQNCSNPDNVPAGGGMEGRKEELLKQIKAAEVMVLPVAMNRKHTTLSSYQMDAAKANQVPILGIKEFGGNAVDPPEVEKFAEQIVEWNDRIIAEAILLLARQEETVQWDVVEFTLD